MCRKMATLLVTWTVGASSTLQSPHRALLKPAQADRLEAPPGLRDPDADRSGDAH